ncbi:hypothetical protein [Spirosoma litoris]
MLADVSLTTWKVRPQPDKQLLTIINVTLIQEAAYLPGLLI